MIEELILLAQTIKMFRRGLKVPFKLGVVFRWRIAFNAARHEMERDVEYWHRY